MVPIIFEFYYCAHHLKLNLKLIVGFLSAINTYRWKESQLLNSLAV
jgi:hypothetical protein